MNKIDWGDPGFWIMELPIACACVGGTIFGVCYGLLFAFG